MEGMRRVFQIKAPLSPGGKKATKTHEQIEEEVQAYLEKGGTIEVLDPGVDQAPRVVLNDEQLAPIHVYSIVK